MPSDRSTLQRGMPGGDHSAWQEPTLPTGRRLPSAPRERKPALAALAVLLILGCALGTGFLVIQSGKRVGAIEISKEIGAGQRIPASAMQEVQIASNSGLSYVPWSQVSQVSRFYAANPIPSGTLLTDAMVASSTTSTAGRALEGLALKDGQLPRDLQVGQHIDIYAVSDSSEDCPGKPGTTLAPNAIVTAILTPEVNSGTSAIADVEVALAPADAGAVACNASNGIVGIAVLPNGGRDAGGTGPGAQPGAGTGSGTTNGGTTNGSTTNGGTGKPGGRRSKTSGHGTH